MKNAIIRFRYVALTFALGLLLGGALVGTALAVNQPHMQSALSSLQTARYNLEHATSDKGGHRTNALNYVNYAITEVQRGISYSNNHR